MEDSTINICMILHLNVNIFECFWVMHNKELVAKLSITAFGLDVIIDTYRTEPRKINFLLLQFYWLKLSTCTKGLPCWKKNGMMARLFMNK